MDSLMIIYAAATVMSVGVLALGLDSLMTRICPDCGAHCRRVRTGDARARGAQFECRSCHAYLMGRRPRR